MTPPDRTPYRVAGAGSDLLPCPWCGDRPAHDHTKADGVRFCCVRCEEETFEDFDSAREYWNTRAPSSPEWEPIESAPRDRFVLVYTPQRDEMAGFVALAKWQGGSWYGVDEDGLTFNPLQAWDFTTHWRPLPAPPTTPLNRGDSSRAEPPPPAGGRE